MNNEHFYIQNFLFDIHYSPGISNIELRIMNDEVRYEND